MSRRPSPFWRCCKCPLVSLALVLLLSTAVSRAQLIVGVDDATEGIWNMNPNTNAVQTFLPGFAGSSLATDEVNKVLYFMPNTVALWKWDYSRRGIRRCSSRI